VCLVLALLPLSRFELAALAEPLAALATTAISLSFLRSIYYSARRN
jgi:hypothetical protein